MARVVALLRGVNIGKRQLSMASLRTALEAAGCTDVATYVQSGNVVLTPPVGRARTVAAWLGGVISDLAGFDVTVVVRTARQMRSVVAGTPYPDAGGTTLHVIFCSSAPGDSLLAAIDLDGVAPEHATAVGSDIYLHLPNGMGRATLPALVERQLRSAGIVGTARNWNTVEHLLTMCGVGEHGRMADDRSHRPRVERANTILYCERFAETVAFYRSLLGPDSVTFENEWFVELAVGDGSSLSVADAARATVAPSHGAGITLSWRVADVVADRARLLAAGFDVSPVRTRFGAPVVDLFDPEAHRVELWSPAP